MAGLNTLFIFITGFIAHLNAGTVMRIYIRDNNPALKGGDIQLVCQISQFSSESLYVYKSDSRLPSSIGDYKSLTQCFPSICLTTASGRYKFSADSSNVFINITNVYRSEDQKWWTCVIGNQKQDLLLNIITVPTSLQYDNPPSQDQDLVQNAVQLKCSTGCSYPQPTISWYYSESGTDSIQAWSSTGTATDTISGCSDSERKYSSTLSLPRYTTFPGNLQKTIKYMCSIQQFTGMLQPLNTNFSKEIQFAVKVTSVTLKDGSNPVSGQLQVVSGVSKTLTCDTSVSRQVATIVWYIGTEEKKRGTSNTFTFTPNNGDHSKNVYCKAFNTQSESQAVSSVQSTLNIQVQVSSATLKDGSNPVTGQLQVVSGVSKTLTCDTSVSRPVATIVWYIGTEEKKRSTSNTFTLTPDNSDHNKKVYCKAFNTQPDGQAVSSIQSTLYVKVYATTPTLSNQTAGNLILLENDSITLDCITSATRTAATVSWFKGSSSLTNIKNTNIAQDNLVSVKSVVTFTPEKSDDKKVIMCQSFVQGQSDRPSAQVAITVYWPPSTPTIPVVQFPFLEGDTGKNIYCMANDYGNPVSTATWTKQYGTADSSDSRRLNLPMMTSQMNGSPASCQLNNYFTQVKGLTRKSQTVRLDVEYNPIIQIMINGVTTNYVTRNEGKQVSALCNATGNPTPTVNWNGQGSSSSYLIFDDINRSNHGTYTCRAETISTKHPIYDFVSEKNLDITVNYAPEVSVVVSEADPVENIGFKISCNATGRPNIYTFTSMVHTWRGITIRKFPVNGPFNGQIEIKKLQLEDSGTYTCHVNNGIPDRNQQIDQVGKTDITARVSPKVLLDDGYIFAGAPGKSINISIPFYCSPDIQTVKFQFKNGIEIQNSDKYTVSYIRQTVTAQFYGKSVELDGYVAVLNIVKEEEKDFVNYTLALGNGIGQAKIWNIYHLSESTPLNPTLLYHIGKIDGADNFIFMKSVNRGRAHTFVIETMAYGSNSWIERLRFDESDMKYLQNDQMFYRFGIKGLVPGVNSLRILAGNDIAADLAPKINFTVDRNVEPCQSAQTGNDNTSAIVGGSLSVVIVGLIIANVLIIRRMVSKQSGGKSSENPDSSGPCSTYDSLQSRNEPNSTYSTLTGPTHDIKDNTYENMKTQGRLVTSDDL